MKLNNFFFLGNGRRICFWEDCWCGEDVLSQVFPSLYSLANPQGVRVADVWDNGRGEGAWNPSFISDLK